MMSSDRDNKQSGTELTIKLAARRFYEELEQRCKPYLPTHFIPRIVEIMRAFHRVGRYVHAPSYQLGIAIEANCAYHRGHSDGVLTRKQYVRIKNLFHDQEQPELKLILEEDFGSFFLVMHRQQIELQRTFSNLDVSRYRRLFVQSDPLPNASDAFAQRYGLTPEEWIKASFAAFVAAESNARGLISAAPADEGVKLSPDAFQRYLYEAAYTPRQIGERFKNVRVATPPKYHACIRSVFLERPLVRLGHDQFVVPFPALAFHHAATGLHERMLSLPEFDQEFGKSVERYVEATARCLPEVHVMVGERELSARAHSSSCDLLVEFDNYILLFESKAAIFSRNIITPSTIPNDNSTRKVAQVFVQLYRTAHDLHQGRFEDLGVSNSKPVQGVVVTFGEIPFANAAWYFERYLLSAAEKKLSVPIYPSATMTETPIVLSLEGLERLVMVMCAHRRSLPELREEKSRRGYTATGDWDGYLGSLASSEEAVLQHLPHVHTDFEDFFESLGLERQN